MVIDRLSMNVGESTTIYIEILSLATPVSELKYGDSKYDKDGDVHVWYGTDNPDASGWVKLPWSDTNYTGSLIKMASDSQNYSDVIYRVLNNDIDFNEHEYITTHLTKEVK